MCRYRYCYFGACRHQKTILYDFCENAQPVTGKPCSDVAAIEALAQVQDGEERTAPARCEERRVVAMSRQQSTVTDCTTQSSEPASPSTTATTLIASSQTSFEETNAFTSALSAIDCTSSLDAGHSSRHSSPASASIVTRDMAGLPIPNWDFRQWMSGSTRSAAKDDAVSPTSKEPDISQDTPSDVTPTPSRVARLKQPGIRQDSDESCDLPRSNDILQHIAEACQQGSPSGTVAGQYRPSYSSVVSGRSSQQDRYETHRVCDTLEAELDSLKNNITKLRQEADIGSSQPKTAQQLANDKYLSTRSNGNSLRLRMAEESAAAKLQRLHEAQREAVSTYSSKNVQAVTVPQAQEFPALQSGPVPGSRPAESVRKPSYAHAATTGMKEGISRAFPGTQGGAQSGQLSDATTLCSHDDTDAEGSVIVTRGVQDFQDGRDLSSAPETTTPALDNKTVRVPHFAQPTKSFASRAGATLKKESSPSTKRSPVSPTKNKEPQLSTAKRADQKRKSLPGEWTMVTPKTSGKPVAAPEEIDAPKSKLPKPSTAKVGVAQNKENMPAKMKVKSKKQIPMNGRATGGSDANNVVLLDRSAEGATTNGPPRKAKRAGQEQAPMESRSATESSHSSSVCFILESNAGLQKPKPHMNKELGEPNLNMRTTVFGFPSQQSNAFGLAMPSMSSTAPEGGLTPMAQGGGTSSQGLSMLQSVSNTTTKRRTSHGHILKPIVACLDARGLLKKNAKNAVFEQYFSAAPDATIDPEAFPLPQTPTRRSEARSSSTLAVNSEYAYKAVPPHMRKSRESSTASLTSESAGPQHRVGLVSGPTIQQNSQAVNGTRIDSLASLNLAMDARKPSLRPTAQVFQPAQMLRLVHLAEEIDPWRYYTDEEWSSLSPAFKDKILAMRGTPRNKGGFTFTARRGWDAQHTTPAGSNAFAAASSLGSVFDQPAPSFQTGSTITPALSPGKQNVRWTMRDYYGKETPVKFGRAPPPAMTPVFGSGTTEASTGSLGMSPETPVPLSGWQIGSKSTHQSYAWKGGDGKEIRFSGYGPYAERDPNHAVNFNFHGTSSNMVPGWSKENFSPPSECVAPRSQRQWAEKLGYQKIPCGNMEITHAVEQVPLGQQLAGYCYDCAGR